MNTKILLILLAIIALSVVFYTVLNSKEVIVESSQTPVATSTVKPPSSLFIDEDRQEIPAPALTDAQELKKTDVADDAYESSRENTNIHPINYSTKKSELSEYPIIVTHLTAQDLEAMQEAEPLKPNKHQADQRPISKEGMERYDAIQKHLYEYSFANKLLQEGFRVNQVDCKSESCAIHLVNINNMDLSESNNTGSLSNYLSVHLEDAEQDIFGDFDYMQDLLDSIEDEISVISEQNNGVVYWSWFEDGWL